MAKPKLEAVITADSSGFQAGITKANKSVGNLEKTSKSMAKNMKLLGAAVLAAVGVIAVKAAKKIIKFGKELTKLGQKSLSLKKSFKSLAEAAGASSKKILADMKKATRGTIAEVDLLATANKMLLLGLDTSIFDEVMEIARRTAKATGMDINYMIESLSMGLGRQSKMILDNLGIVFDVSEAYEWYAETLGKTSAQLTESEKKLGFQTYAMKIARENVEKLGEDTLTLAEVGGVFTAKWADLKAFIGEKLVGAISAVIEKFGGWEIVMGKVEQFIEGTLKPAIEKVIKKIEGFGTTLAEADYSEFIKTLEGLGTTLGNLAKSFTDFGDDVEESKSGWQGYLDVLNIIGIILIKIGQFITIVVEAIKFGGTIIGNFIAIVYGAITGFTRGFGEAKDGTDRFAAGISEAWKEIKIFTGIADEAIEKVGVGLTEAVEDFIDLEIPHKEIVIDHSFDKIKSDYDILIGELKDIKRTVTYTVRTVEAVRPTREPEFQFGGIIPKTQRILAHGGEMMLTREMQRNLLTLLRQPRTNTYNLSTPISISSLVVREEADIYKIADQLYELQSITQRGGGLK